MLYPVPKPVKRVKAKKKAKKIQGTKYWIKKCDDVARKICHARRKCENPFRETHTDVLQWAHIVTRGEKIIRHDEDNCLLLCSGCHAYYTYNPAQWNIMICELLGKEHFWALHERVRNSTIKPDYEQRYYTLLERWDTVERSLKPPSIFDLVPMPKVEKEANLV